jgi:hypothetical protein
MEALYPIDDQKLDWSSAAGIGRRYLLNCSRGVIADLEFSKRPTKEATGHTIAHSWHLKPIGVMGTRYEIRRAGDSAVFTTIQLNLGRTKGVLAVPGTPLKLSFAATNIFCTDWQWLDENGWGLMGLRQKGLSRLAADVHLADHAAQHPLTPLLFVAGFYLVYLNFERQLAQIAQESNVQLENLARATTVQRKKLKKQFLNELAQK